MFVIGKSKNPRCFKNVKSLPTEYVANKKAWMTSEIFTNWLHQIDKKMTKDLTFLKQRGFCDFPITNMGNLSVPDMFAQTRTVNLSLLCFPP
jgi:hypothetical protein